MREEHLSAYLPSGKLSAPLLALHQLIFFLKNGRVGKWTGPLVWVESLLVCVAFFFFFQIRAQQRLIRKSACLCIPCSCHLCFHTSLMCSVLGSLFSVQFIFRIRASPGALISTYMNSDFFQQWHLLTRQEQSKKGKNSKNPLPKITYQAVVQIKQFFPLLSTP